MFEIFSKIVARKSEIIFIVIAFPKLCTVCHTDDNGIRLGSYLNTANKRVAGHSKAEYLGIKYSVFDVLMTNTRIFQGHPVFLVKNIIFLYTGKTHTSI